jgi:hypothetical protein
LRRMLNNDEYPEAVRRIVRSSLHNAFCRNPDMLLGAADPNS